MQPCFYLLLFVLFLCAGVPLGSAGLGHRIFFFDFYICIFTPFIFMYILYFVLVHVVFKTCIILSVVSIALFCMSK